MTDSRNVGKRDVCSRFFVDNLDIASKTNQEFFLSKNGHNIYYPAWDLRISKNSEIPCQLTPEAELVSSKFSNVSSATQCTN